MGSSQFRIVESDHVCPGLVVCLRNGQVVWFGPVEQIATSEEFDLVHCFEGEKQEIVRALNDAAKRPRSSKPER